MPDNVVASIPLGWILAAALLIGLLGVFVGWLVGAWRQRRQRSQAQRLAGQHAAAALNSLPQAACLLAGDGAVLAQNAAAAALRQEFDPPGEWPAEVTRAVQRAVRSGAAETIAIPPPQPDLRSSQALVAPLFGSAGGRAGGEKALLLILDAPASARSEFSQRLARNLAHELRTPLTAILGHVEILNSCTITEEALWRRSLGFISSETERLARLVEDMLYLARLERVPLEIQPVDLRLAAEGALATVREQAEKNQAALTLQAPVGLPRACADPDRIRQVLINLLDNAIKYAPGCSVAVRLAEEPGRVTVEIHDTGPGAPPEELARIFEPFYRGQHAAGRMRGAGLGLAIVQTILDQHHAPIQATSNPTDGTRFTFSLPAESSL